MAKIDKEYKARMDGMMYAYKIADEKGIEELRKEILTRGFFKLDISLPMGYAEEAYKFMSQNLYQSVISTVLWVLKQKRKYNSKSLHQFKKWYDEEATMLTDLNWHGEHFVTFEDRAKILNEEDDFDFDLSRLLVLKEEDDKSNPAYRKMDLEETCDFLRREGHTDAAECLRKKVEWLRA